MWNEELKSYIKTLIRLMDEEPNLPVIPIVDYDVVADNNAPYYRGKFGGVHLEECAIMYNQVYTDREQFMEEYYKHYSDVIDEKCNDFSSIVFDNEEDKQDNDRLNQLLLNVARLKPQSKGIFYKDGYEQAKKDCIRVICNK